MHQTRRRQRKSKMYTTLNPNDNPSTDVTPKSFPIHRRYLLGVMSVMIVTYIVWHQENIIRELCTLHLPLDIQWMNTKRHFLLSKDLFEPSSLSDINHFENASVAIVGMIRNHDYTIRPLLRQLDNLCCLFRLCSVLIYESNSNDNTPKYLHEWKLRDNVNNKLCSAFNNGTQTPQIMKTLVHPKWNNSSDSRLDRYSAYRNYLLTQTIKQGIHFDYFVPIDLDIYALDIKRVLNALYRAGQSDISVMCLNGIRRSGYMYDSLASIVLDQNNVNESVWLYYMEEVERSNIIYDNEFTQMLSCFGAMAFYNFDLIMESNCSYVTSSTAVDQYPMLQKYYYINPRKGDVGICEHISFNYCLYKHNAKLAIARDAYLYYGFWS